jgi:hypothetical protein
MSIKFREKDYLIIDFNGKNKLGKVAAVKGDKKSGTIILEEALGRDGELREKFSRDDVVANLGTEPKTGKAFGVSVEPYKRSLEHKKFGQIDLYLDITDKHITRLFKGLDTAYALFKKNASTDFLPLGKNLELRHNSGKMVGKYAFRQKKNENQDTMLLCPVDFRDPTYNLYVICHEMAHGLWFRCVPSNVKARWIKLYESRMVVRDIPKVSLKGLMREVKNYQCDIKSYMKEAADEDTTLILKEVSKYIKRLHRLSERELFLACSEDQGLLETVWPSRTQLSEPQADVSEYALHSTPEFFAEALALSLTGTLLPKDVKKELKATMRQLTIIYNE